MSRVTFTRGLLVVMFAMLVIAGIYGGYVRVNLEAELESANAKLEAMEEELEEKDSEIKEYEELKDMCVEFFSNYSEGFKEEALAYASHRPDWGIGYVLINKDGTRKIGAAMDYDEFVQVAESLDANEWITGNYWYCVH